MVGDGGDLAITDWRLFQTIVNKLRLGEANVII